MMVAMQRSSSGRPTMVDVAADAGVSLKTVSRVVNGVATVDEALAARVLASVERLGFRRNDVAANLRAGTGTSTIGLITADFSNAFYTTLAGGLAGSARGQGFHIITASSEEDPELERTTALDLCQRRVSGLVMVPTDTDHSYLLPEMQRGIPVVFVDRPGNGLDADAVLADNAGGARLAVEHLLTAGHRRIAMLTDSLGIFTMRERLDGVRTALRAVGAALDETLVRTGVHSPTDAAKVAADLLRSEHPPTALIAANNRATTGAVEAIRRDGADVEVVGFDDFELSGLLPMPVTIVDYDIAALGATAGERLFARLGGDTSEPTTTRLPTRLIQRGGSWA